MPVYSTIKIRGYHLDVYGHVNNARYLEFLEDARWEYLLNHLDLAAWREQSLMWVVVNVNINYRRPAALGEVVEVTAAMSRIGHRSAVIHQDVRLAGTDTLVADADITFVVADEKEGRAVPIEGEIRHVLERLLAEDRQLRD